MRVATYCTLVLLFACGAHDVTSESGGGSGDLAIAPDIEDRLAALVPMEITADLSVLSAEDRQALDRLVDASRLVDEIFLRQVWTGNPDLRSRLAELRGPGADAARAYFRVNYGPWDRLDELEPFIGDEPHPPGAGFYPANLTAEQFEVWILAHPDDAAALRSTTTVIRSSEGQIVAEPYSQVYAEWLQPAADLLRQAAAATANPSLRKFLELRAAAFLDDDYYQSDMAWMDLDAALEVTIGPYETYEDSLMGYKAAFESFVTVALPAESAALDHYKELLPWLERNLPIPDEHKNLDRGSESPIRVVDVVFAAGDGRAGVQTLAFNLPNDERVREAKGSKKVMLHNVLRAKYDAILTPIAARVLAPDQVQSISFDAFFNESLHHELSHGLGPGKIEVNGRETEVRLELKELYSTLEEAKADVAGVYNILALIERGDMPAELRSSLEPTYVAGLFRAARFGLHEAHGRGVVAQFNYLLEKGALEVDADGNFRAVSGAFGGAIRDLLHDMLMLQATGDYAGTVAFLDRYGRASEELVAAVDRLADVPVDIRPIYTAVGEGP